MLKKYIQSCTSLPLKRQKYTGKKYPGYLGTAANLLQWHFFQWQYKSGIFGLRANGSTANVTTAKFRRLFGYNRTIETMQNIENYFDTEKN